jgi:hypothetical protein
MTAAQNEVMDNKNGEGKKVNGNGGNTNKTHKRRRRNKPTAATNFDQTRNGSTNIKNVDPPRHERDSTTSSNRIELNKKETEIVDKKETTTLFWKRPHEPVAIASEEILLPLLIRYGKKERGMMKSHPRRLGSIRDACRNNGITLDQALSLRRTHMMLLNPQVNNTFPLHLGRSKDVQESASLFEKSIAQYLAQQNIKYLSETDQKAMVAEGKKTPPTPDFLFDGPICLSSHQLVAPINWIEAKMFYGASTIADGTKNAVGGLQRTARRYVKSHGPGAFVFSHGFGIRIKTMLEAEGTFALDAKPLDLTEMREHQRTWCANDRGQILP